MNDSTARCENLKEVVADMTAGTVPGSVDRIRRPVTVRFIFGLGPAGLTPFEYKLAGRRAGETVTVRTGADGLEQMFGHLTSLLPACLKGSGEIYLAIHIRDIKQASPKDVIRSLAEIADCGDGCCGH